MNPFHHRGLALATGLAALSLLSPAAAQPVGPGQEGDLGKLLPPVHGRTICFARTYDAQHLRKHPKQKVTALRFRLSYHRHEPDEWHPQGQRNYYFRMSAAVKGQKKTLYASGECVPGTGGFGCGPDCDGGGVSVERAPDNGSITIRLEDRLRMTLGCGGEEDDTVDLTPGADDKVFRLDQASPSTCRSLERM